MHSNMFKDHVTYSAVLGANVGLAGVKGALGPILHQATDVGQFLLVLLQVAVAVLTAVFIWTKIRAQKAELKQLKARDKRRKSCRSRKTISRKRKHAFTESAKILILAATVMLMTSCTAPNVKPGRVDTELATQVQPENPKDKTQLATERTVEKSFTLPPASVVREINPQTGETTEFVNSESMPVLLRIYEKVDSSLGAADMSIAKIAAKLKSMKWVQVVGVFIFLFGAASLVYPPLRAIVASATTSLMISAAGIGLIVLPIVVVGNEVLILAGCVGVAGAYLFIHRYGRKDGENRILKRWVDKNKDGKVDPGEFE